MSASAAEVGRNVMCADGWRVTMHLKVRRGPLQGPDSERQGPTNRMSAGMFSGSPHSTRATTSDRTERQVTSEAAAKRPEREGRRGQPAPGSAFPRDAATADQRLMTRTLPLPSLGGGRRWPVHRLRDHPLRVSRMVAASATHPNIAKGTRTIPGSTRGGDRFGHVGGLGKRRTAGCLTILATARARGTGCRQRHADERISAACRSDTSGRAIVDADTVTGARERGLSTVAFAPRPGLMTKAGGAR